MSGKQLSTNDYTTAEKNKLASLSNYDDSEVRSLISGKVDKVFGKGLSTNDFTTAEKNKLAGIAIGANNYSLPAASSTTRGGVKLGYTASGKNYPVQASEEKLYVNVPWTNTTYSPATTSADGLMSAADK